MTLTKQINCPEHLTHKATLHVFPSDYAGVWECGDISGVCEHTEFHTDTVEVPIMRNDEYDTYERMVEICNECESVVNE